MSLVSAAAVAAPFRLPAWLETIFSLLPKTRPTVRVPDPPPELRPLLEMARNTLGACDMADLNRRLNECVMRMQALPLLASPDEVPPSADESRRDLPDVAPGESIIAEALGMNVATKILRGIHEFDLVVRAIEQAQEEVDSPRSALARRALMVRSWSLHEGHVVPHALIESAIVQDRGFVALGALIAACVDGRRPEPWLANALADVVLASVRERLRLLASAGYDVGPIAPEELFDLEALFREAEEADAAFLAAFEEGVRADCNCAPEDE